MRPEIGYHRHIIYRRSKINVISFIDVNQKIKEIIYISGTYIIV